MSPAGKQLGALVKGSRGQAFRVVPFRDGEFVEGNEPGVIAPERIPSAMIKSERVRRFLTPMSPEPNQ